MPSSQPLSVSVTPQAHAEAHCGNVRVAISTPDGTVSVDVNGPQSSAAELDVQDFQGQGRASIRFDLESICTWSPSDSADKPPAAVELISAGVTIVRGQDGSKSAPETTTKGFTIHWDPFDQRIVAVVSQPTLRAGQEFPSTAPPPVVSQLLGDNSSQEDEEELDRLVRVVQQAEDELERLVHRIADGRKRIEQLIESDDPADDQDSIKNCGGLKCVLRTLYSKGKNCIHRIYVRVARFVSPASSQSCSYMASVSPASRVKVLMDPANSCYDEKKRPNSTEYILLHDSHEKLDDADYDILDDQDSSSTAHISSLSAGEEAAAGAYRKRLTFYSIAGAVASVLCLGCLFVVVKSRCCNPRAKADRAARCEEWRNRREYRRLARRRAVRDWIDRHSLNLGSCFCCGDFNEKSSADYEEKRALVLRQGQIMEEVQQAEIRTLQRAHRLNMDLASAAEEGRAPLPRSLRQPTRRPSTSAPRLVRANSAGSDSSAGNSLPSYRSRASSGGWAQPPPSYRERTPLVQSPTADTPDFDPAAYVVDGFRNYSSATPSESGDVSERASSDLTPDSSVIALSPRGSSETLRTERSAL